MWGRIDFFRPPPPETAVGPVYLEMVENPSHYLGSRTRSLPAR